MIEAGETEEGPDPNDVRRHAKKMLTELQYRRKYRRIDFYRPNRKQMLFHNLIAVERALRAGNQLGKTQGAAAQMAMDALSFYPDWYSGRKFLVPPKIERTMDFLGWIACTSSVKVRDGAQLKLLGDVREQGGLGTGMIPLDNIVGRPTMARGIADFVDSATLRRETGGKAVLRFKTYEMGREAFQGEPVDEVWLDEDVSRDDDSIYGECIARLTTTQGQIICSLTPLLGMSPLRRRFKKAQAGVAEVLMTIDDCLVSVGGHIPDAELESLIARTDENKRATRLYGADMQGEGAVFNIPVELIKEQADPASFPDYWAWLWALDFSHSGLSPLGHPFAAVLAAHDRDHDVIHIVHAIRMRQSLAANHVAAIKESPWWEAPVAWPHDGGRGAGLISGETIAAIYKRMGLNMRPKNAAFKDGGYNLEAGITIMEERFAARKLVIASHLHEVLDEYQGYHRENGLVVKLDDDLLSAIRVLCMDIRFAKPSREWRGNLLRGGPLGVAPGTDFDVFAPMSA